MPRAGRGVAAAVLSSVMTAGCGGGAGQPLTSTPAPVASATVTQADPSAATPASAARGDAPSQEVVLSSSSEPSPRPSRPTSPPPSAPASQPAVEGIALPTYGDGPVPRSVLRDASIVGSADRQCVWLLDAEGHRHAALWPRGYRAGFDPVRVFNAAGRPVWGEGHVQDVGGGFTSAGVERLAEACRTGDRVWWVGELDASAEPTGEPGPR